MVSTAEKCTHGEANQFPPTLRPRDVQTQLPVLQCQSAWFDAHIESILVVADEDGRRATEDAYTVHGHVQSQHSITRECSHRCEKGCRPLRPAAPLNGLTMMHHVRIESESRVVDEHPVVDARDVDIYDATIREQLHRFVDFKWDAKIFREVIQGPKGEYAEWDRCSSEDGCDGADRSVSTSSHHEIRGVIDCASCCLLEFVSALAVDHDDAMLGRQFPYATGRGCVDASRRYIQE